MTRSILTGIAVAGGPGVDDDLEYIFVVPDNFSKVSLSVFQKVLLKAFCNTLPIAASISVFSSDSTVPKNDVSGKVPTLS